MISGNKKTTYGKSGDAVKIISLHHPAVIVENEKGYRFTTQLKNLK